MFLSLLTHFLPFFPNQPPPTLSVIIPTYNESTELPTTISTLLSNSSHTPQILVLDAHSTDHTCCLARRAGAITRTISGGRGVQLNAGAKLATAPVLLFLHADTHVPYHYDREIETMLREGRHFAGAFSLRISGGGWGVRVVERVANWRAKWMRTPYGDQGLFMSKENFERIGGFKRMPFLEDYDIVRRIGREGTIGIAKSPVLTSGRRWERLGVVRTTILNQLVIAGYHLGFPVEHLRAWYRGVLIQATKRNSRKKFACVAGGPTSP